MHIIIGLGNPGKEYEGTRHNIGFEAVAGLAGRFKAGLSQKRRIKAVAGEADIGGSRVILAMPQTYMNNSGMTVREILKNNEVPVSHIIVIHDEIDLPVGVLKIKKGGGSAGHKGIESIALAVGSKEFVRIRVGVGRPEDEGREGADYVLSKIPKSHRAELEEAVGKACDAAESVVKDGLHRAMEVFNRSEKTKK